MRSLWILPASLAMAVAAAAPALAASPASARIGDDFFERRVLRVPVGAAVTWDHKGLLRHTVTADTGDFHSGDLERGKTFTRRFTKPGAFSYFCVYHGAPGGRGMSGLVLVGGAKPPPAPEPKAPRPEGPATLRVPQEFPEIQAAVDAARPGDLVLISLGVYEEAVVVSTPRLTIRGLSRLNTVLEGGFSRANGFLVSADGVAIENLTARHFAVNGFYWWTVEGYRGSYLTAIRNGDYGLYSINSRHGQFDHVYAAGSPDSGIYIGGCQPCDAVVTDSLAEHNALGFSGTNAGGNLIIANSEWRHNFSGIVPNTLDSERYAPQRDVVIAGNWVHDNGNPEAPSKPPQYASIGVGILLAGTERDRVEANLVERNSSYGILVIANIDLSFWMPFRNRVQDNVVRDSGRADLAVGGPAGPGNCFRGNAHSTSLPPAIETFYRCGSPLNRVGGGDFGVVAERLALFAKALSERYPHGDWKTAPAPAAAFQPEMPGAAAAPPRPAVLEPSIPLDPEQIALPSTRPVLPGPAKEVTVLGVSATPVPLSLFLGLYAYALPLALYATWVSLSVWDLARREDLSGGRRVGWAAFVLLVPAAGPVVYLLGGKPAIPRGLRLFLVFGGIGLYLVLAGLSFLGLTA